MQVPKQPGTYILLIQMPEPCQVTVGALGVCLFDAGWYLYVGSAMGGLRQRLARHAREHKRLHWHIDYVLAQAKLCEIWCHVGTERLECLWANVLTETPGFIPYARRLGASDCACTTHLFFTADRPSSATLARLCSQDDLVVAGVDDLRDPAPPTMP